MSHEAIFCKALLDPQHAIPKALKTWNGSDPATRFGVYRNNVVVSLIDSLADTFPVTQQLVGERFFRAMARVYAIDSPPWSPVMNRYGDQFPAFIESFAPAAPVPYLADVARLEYLRVRAYHAADAVPIDPGALAPLLADSERLPSLRACLHPSAALLRSNHAVVSLWAAHQGCGELQGLDTGRPEQALVIRPALEVDVVPLDLGSWSFASALQQGNRLGDALETTMSAVEDFDPAASLGRLIRAGLITSLQPAADTNNE